MSNEENKVQFGLENVYYATLGDSGYGTPTPIPGAVNLTLNPVGDIEKFYADNMLFWASATNDGYEGELEVVKFPIKMLQEVWGYRISEKDKVLTEIADAATVPFALLFRISGDKNKRNYLIYSCTGTRPSIEGKTVEEGKKTPTTQKISITAAPDSNGLVQSSTTASTPKEVVDAWYTTVYTGETAPAAESGASS